MQPVDKTKELLLSKKLTKRQIAFCRLILEGKIPARAYFKIYREDEGKTFEGKEKNLCRRESARLMSRVHIKRYLEYLTGQASETAIVSKEEILATLSEIMYKPDCADRDRIAACRELLAVHRNIVDPEQDTEKRGVGATLLQSLESLILNQ